VIGRWWKALRRRQAERTLARRPIPDELWALTLVRFPFLARRSPEDLQRLRDLATLFSRARSSPRPTT
jgi:MtfA peptidase